MNRFQPGHADRVARLSYELSRAYGLTEEECQMISDASRYHDIGKIAVPQHLLLKPGPLSRTEMEQVKRHVVYGLKMLAHLSGAEVVKTIIATHHEHWDGNGYPRRVKGKEIPLCGRIAAICDVYDALTSDRPYRAAWSHDQAVSYIRERSGTQFDPTLVELFLRVVTPVGGGV